MVNNGAKNIVPENCRGYEIDTNNILVCKKCGKIYKDEDYVISFKNPNQYYIQCVKCRMKYKIYMDRYMKKKNSLLLDNGNEESGN